MRLVLGLILTLVTSGAAWAGEIVLRRDANGQTTRALYRSKILMDIRPAEAGNFARVFVNGHPVDFDPSPGDLDLPFEILGVRAIDSGRRLLLLRRNYHDETFLILAVYRPPKRSFKILGMSGETVNLPGVQIEWPEPARLTRVTNVPLFKFLTTRSAFELRLAREELISFLCEANDLGRIATIQVDLEILRHIGVRRDATEPRYRDLAENVMARAPWPILPPMFQCGGYTARGAVERGYLEVFRRTTEGQLNRVANRF